MSTRKNYTVLIPYPLGGGHWAEKGQTLELLEVEAQHLEGYGRIRLTADIEAEAAAAVTAETAAKTANKTTAQAAE